MVNDGGFCFETGGAIIYLFIFYPKLLSVNSVLQSSSLYSGFCINCFFFLNVRHISDSVEIREILENKGKVATSIIL